MKLKKRLRLKRSESPARLREIKREREAKERAQLHEKKRRQREAKQQEVGMTVIDLGQWLTIEGAAARSGVSAATIWRAVKAGELHTKRILGRVVIDIGEVDVYRRKRKEAGRTSE